MERKYEESRLGAGSFFLLTAAACALYMVSGGIRCNFGIMVQAIARHSGVDYAGVSFVAAVGQLMYGLMQPVFGVLALKKSNGFALMTGLAMIVAGLLTAPLAHSQAALLVSIGLLFFSGTGGVCFGIIMGTVSPILGPKRAAAVSGLINASSAIGISLLSPVIQALQSSGGISAALRLLCAPVILLFPVVLWISRLSGRVPGSPAESAETGGAWERFRAALREPDYRCLMAGFSTCGFHMCIIQTHIFSQILSYGLPENVAALSYTVFGIAGIIGSVSSGILCQRFRMKNVLALLYGLRSVIIAAFLFFMPKTALSAFIFMAGLGLTGDATVTPTSQIVARRFGAASLGFLFGIVFVCHQIGGFISAWAGGAFIAGGNYVGIWFADIVLCAFASFVSWLIRNKD